MICAVIPLIPMMSREIFKEWFLTGSLIINISPLCCKGGDAGGLMRMLSPRQSHALYERGRIKEMVNGLQ